MLPKNKSGVKNGGAIDTARLASILQRVAFFLLFCYFNFRSKYAHLEKSQLSGSPLMRFKV